MVTEAEVIRQFLDLQYGTDKGTAWISVGGGAKTEKTFSENPFQWPEQAQDVVDFVVAKNEAGYNVWFAAHLSYSKKRSGPEGGQGRAKGMSVKRRRLHVDIDRVLTDQDAAKIRDLDAWVVYSGSPGHVHAYVELDASVDVGTYHRLEDLLVVHFDSDTAVCRDNGLLRIPGTINQMSAKKTHAPAKVTWDGRVTQTKWTPSQIEALIGVETVERVAAKQNDIDFGAGEITPEPVNIPKPVMDILMTAFDDRSGKTAPVVNTCKANGLSIEQTLFCLLADPGQKQRYSEKGSAFMYRELRKLYGTADQYNSAEAEDRKADDILKTEQYRHVENVEQLRYQEPRQLTEQEQDDEDTRILMGMARAQQQYEQQSQQQTQPGVLSAEEQLQQEQGKLWESWDAMNYEDVLDGSYTPTMPTMFTLTTDTSLVYPGLIHSFFGEPGSAKSLLAQFECINQIKLGKDVLYVDFEDNKGTVISRFLEFGGNNEEFKNLLRQHLTYVRPRSTYKEGNPKWEALLSKPFDLCILDGVTESMVLTNHELNDNTDVAKWWGIMPDAINHKTGATVIMIDHVTKSREGNSRMALGGGHKLAAITGAAYVIEQDSNSAVGRGARGVVVMRLSKDRPGYVSGQLGAKKNGLQEAARVVIDSTGPSPVVTFGPHQHEMTEQQKIKSLPRLIFDYVAHNPGFSKTALKAGLKQAGVRMPGNDQKANEVIDLLIAQNHLRAEKHGNTFKIFTGDMPMPQEAPPSAAALLDQD